jgi:hypothetical protein
MLEATDPDAGDRVVDGDVSTTPHERAAAAGRALRVVAEDVVADTGYREGGGHDDHTGHDREHQPAPAPCEHRRQHDPCGEGGKARLRVREVEPGPNPGDRRSRPEQHAPVACEQHRHEQREDRHHQEAPVDRRVPEDRVHPVEGRERVRDEQLGVPEDIARLVLVDPDRREDERHRRQLDQEADRDQAAPGETGEHDRQQAEREVEEEQVDRALAQVLRPEDREARPGDEGGQRPGHRAELPRACVALEQFPREQDGRRGDDRVHRHEQIRLGRADVHVDPRGDARKHGEREHERPAAQHERAGRGEAQPDHRQPAEQRPVPVRGEVDGEQDRSERPGAQAGQPLDTRRRDEQEREPEAAEHAADVPGHGVTVTIAFATCPCSATRRT